MEICGNAMRRPTMVRLPNFLLSSEQMKGCRKRDGAKEKSKGKTNFPEGEAQPSPNSNSIPAIPSPEALHSSILLSSPRGQAPSSTSVSVFSTSSGCLGDVGSGLGGGLVPPSLWRGGDTATSALWRPALAPFSGTDPTAPHAGPGSWAPGRGVHAPLAIEHWCLLVWCASAQSESDTVSRGATHLNMAPPAAGPINDIRSNLLKNLDFVAATQKPRTTLGKAVENALAFTRKSAASPSHYAEP